MDADNRLDEVQVELELQPVRSRHERHELQTSSTGGQTTGQSLGQPDASLSNARRRPSSQSRSRTALPDLTSMKQQAQNTLDDGNVFEEDEPDEEDIVVAADRADSLPGTQQSNAETTGRSSFSSKRSRITLPSAHNDSTTDTVPPTASNSTDAFAAPRGEPSTPFVQSRPAEIPNMTAEILFIFVCSTGQLLFGFLTGGVAGLQIILVDRLGISVAQTPWLLGSYLLANGLSVIVCGPLADLLRPKWLMCGAFAWQALVNIVGIFSLNNQYLFFVVRGAQGLSVGVLVSSSISVLGRVYQPGLRKTRVFSIMAAMAPLGYWLGTLLGGVFSHAPKYIFAVNTLIAGLCCAGGLYAIPNIQPALAGLTMRSFDFAGSALAVIGCALLVAGLTQGPSANWTPYTIALVLVGLAAMIAFFYVERIVRRPLLPPALWKVPGFTALIIAYFLGFGGFMAWQFYAIQFWLKIQNVSPLFVALYMTPNAIFGVLATFIVSRTAHLVGGHWILAASMLAFALGPVFFLPQTANTTYWALSMPGIALVTFGPDLSFAAASIFVTSSVAKHYQGSAGSLLVTVQNLSAAIMTSISDTIGERTKGTGADASLKMFHSIWWFDFAAAVAGALITLALVRIPKTVEKEHEQ